MEFEGENNEKSELDVKDFVQTQESDSSLNVKVLAQDGTETFFKLKPRTPLGKLMQAFCQRQSTNPNSIRFLYDGQRVQTDDTPEKLGMEEGDTIDAVLQQLGGGEILLPVAMQPAFLMK